MSSHLSVGTDKALVVTASDRDPATIINSSGGTLYYKNASDVDSGDSSLAVGSSAEVTAVNWIVASASTHVLILRNDDREDADFPESREQIRTVDGPVYSGTVATSGTLAGVAETDTVIYSKDSKTFYVNENTAISPYWTPTSFSGPGLFGVYDDFRTVKGDVLTGGVPAITGTGTVNHTGLGTRIVGPAVDETDGGAAPGTDVEGAQVLRLTADNADGSLCGLAGSVVAQFQPDAHAPLVVDVTYTHVSAITARSTFVGFCGVVADAVAEPITGATTVATFVPDDITGIWMDSVLTDGDGLMLVSEKANLATTQTSLVAAAAQPAAATYARYRVEIQADGTTVAFKDKAVLGTIVGASGAGAHAAGTVAADPTEEYIPLVYICPSTTTAASIDVKQFFFYGTRI